MRGANGESRVFNNTLETIHAAANAIASAENRVPQATVQKRRWGGWWSIYWCFGSYKQKKRIGHAILVSETSGSGGYVPATENPTQAPTITLPFVAPPSSPASFLPSEPPSATQSPSGMVSFTSISASMYSPGPTSIFAIGPYAHETQLVSPPVFSAFPTEPSTAPFTPPPESVHLTNPSSPEVPFARFLGPNLQYGEVGQRFPISHYEFQSYQLQPGSPVGQLISPSSGISGSGTSSPFPDIDFVAGLRFTEFQMGGPPKLLNLDKLSDREWGSHYGSGTLTPDGTTSTPRNGFLLDHQISEIVLRQRLDRENQSDQVAVNHRVSFGLTNKTAARYVENETATPSGGVPESLQNEAAREIEECGTKVVETYEFHVGETYNGRPDKAPAYGEGKPQHHKDRTITLGSAKEFNFDYIDGCLETETTTPCKAVPESLLNEEEAREREQNTNKLMETCEFRVGETDNERREAEKNPADREGKPQHHKNRSSTLGSTKEFNFDNVDGGDVYNKPIVSSDWWANEKVAGNDDGVPKKWSFFPMMQPGVS